jgi:hypothetical protein
MTDDLGLALDARKDMTLDKSPYRISTAPLGSPPSRKYPQSGVNHPLRQPDLPISSPHPIPASPPIRLQSRSAGYHPATSHWATKQAPFR